MVRERTEHVIQIGRNRRGLSASQLLNVGIEMVVVDVFQ